MKVRTRRIASLSAAAIAAAALAWGSSAQVQARDLTWDADGPGGSLGTDGGGAWNTTDANWVDGDLVTGTNVTWSNGAPPTTPPDNAIFGNATSTVANPVPPANFVDFAEAINVQNMTIGVGTNGAAYSFSDFNGGSLTLYGNVTKAGGTGVTEFLLVNGPLNLAAGDHQFIMRDSPGDVPEMAMTGSVGGAGGITIDNGPYEAWGTMVMRSDNSYTGATNINKGRLVIVSNNGLGTNAGGTTIANQGTLSIGGAGSTVLNGGVTLDEPITITRDTYAGPEFDRYTYAIFSANGSGTNTFTGPFFVDSTDARIRVETSTVTIASNIQSHIPNGVLTLDGDFAGFVNLTGDNTAYGSAGNAIKIMGGVEVNASDEKNLGGATSKLILAGGTIHPIGSLATGAFMTNFGAHDISATPVNTGVDLDAGTTFTVNGLSGVGVGERGTGTLNFQGTNTFTGSPFFDGGTINFVAGSSTSQKGLRLRSPVLNVAGALDVSGSFSSIGVDSTGTNGGPDKAIINITGNGSLIETTGDDFNISDNANTEGTINMSGNAVLTTGGITWLGKSNGAKGTINQNGGTLTINRGGNFGFVIADGRGARTPSGYYNLNAGSFTSAGEVYVGEGGSNAVGGNRAHGYWTQTGGTANINNWFVIGRESAVGSFDMSGGVLNHNGGNMSLGDSNAGGEANTVKVHGNAVINDIAGEMWVGTGGGTITNMSVYDTAQITVNNWFPVGRGGAQGTLDVYGNAVITKAGANNAYVGESTTAVTSTMTVRQNAVFNETSGEFWVGQGGGVGILNVQDNASFSVNNWFALGRANGASSGTVNFSGGTISKAGGGFLAIGSGGTGTFNQTGGTLTSNGTRLGEASSGTMNLSGGSATFTGEFSLGYNGGLIGTLNISNTANVTVPDVIVGVNAANPAFGGALNLNGGTLTGASFTGGASATALRNFKFNGGLLKPSADSTNFIGAKINSIVSTGGARIDSNAHVVTVNSALTHDSALGGADGGLTKSGAGTLTVAGVNTYTGPTVASAGKLTLGKSLTTSSSVSSQNDATIELAEDGSHNKVIKTGPVSIAANARIDLKDNKLITTTPAGTASGGTYNGLQGQVQRAYDFGGWDQPGLTTSEANAVAGLTTIGIATGEQVRGLGPTDTDTFAGQTINGASVIAMYTYAGDANLDGTIDGGDYGIIDNFVQVPGASGYGNGDFNYDGVIDGGDYGIIDNNIQAQGAPFPTSGAAVATSATSAGLSGVTAVPEPASLSVIGLAAASLLGRRRRRVATIGCE